MSNGTFVIRHFTSGLVLDASDEVVSLDYFTGAPCQKWLLEEVDNGYSVFVNVGNGKALDIQQADEHANIITYTRHDGTNQQWIVNTDERSIESAEGSVLDVFEANYVPGNKIVAFEKNGQDNQKFYIQYC